MEQSRVTDQTDQEDFIRTPRCIDDRLTFHDEPATHDVYQDPWLTVALVERYEISVDVLRDYNDQLLRSCASACLTAAAAWAHARSISIEATPFFEPTRVGVRWQVDVGHGSYDPSVLDGEEDSDTESTRWIWSARWRHWADRFERMWRPDLRLASVTPLFSDEQSEAELAAAVTALVGENTLPCGRCGEVHDGAGFFCQRSTGRVTAPVAAGQSNEIVEPWHGKAGPNAWGEGPWR